MVRNINFNAAKLSVFGQSAKNCDQVICISIEENSLGQRVKSENNINCVRYLWAKIL